MALFARRDRPTVAQPVRARERPVVDAPQWVCSCPSNHKHHRPCPCQYTEQIAPNSDVLVWGCPCRGDQR